MQCNSVFSKSNFAQMECRSNLQKFCYLMLRLIPSRGRESPLTASHCTPSVGLVHYLNTHHEVLNNLDSARTIFEHLFIWLYAGTCLGFSRSQKRCVAMAFTNWLQSFFTLELMTTPSLNTASSPSSSGSLEAK